MWIIYYFNFTSSSSMIFLNSSFSLAPKKLCSILPLLSNISVSGIACTFLRYMFIKSDDGNRFKYFTFDFDIISFATFIWSFEYSPF